MRSLPRKRQSAIELARGATRIYARHRFSRRCGYSTVTLLARLRGLSMSRPSLAAM